MDNLSNLMRLVGVPISGIAFAFVLIGLTGLAFCFAVYFFWSASGNGRDRSKARRLPTSVDWRRMKILARVFVVCLVVFIGLWIGLIAHPDYARASLQRLTQGGREPMLFAVRLLTNISIFLAIIFIALIGIVQRDWYRDTSQPRTGGPQGKKPS